MEEKKIVNNKTGVPLAHYRERFAAADGPCKLEGAVFEIDPKTGKCLSVEAIRIED